MDLHEVWSRWALSRRPGHKVAECKATAGGIVEVSQEPVALPADVASQVEKARENGRKVVLLLVDKDGDMRFIPLRIKEE